MPEVHQLFLYSVFEGSGIVIDAYIPWSDVEALLELLDVEPDEVFVDHGAPDECTVTLPCLEQDDIDMLAMRSMVKETLRKSPPVHEMIYNNLYEV